MNRRRIALATTLLLMATVVSAQPPTDRNMPPKSTKRLTLPEMIAQLQALEASDAEVRKLAEQLKGMDPGQLRKMMEQFKNMPAPQNVPPGALPNIPPPAGKDKPSIPPPSGQDTPSPMGKDVPPVPSGKDTPPNPPIGPMTPDPTPPPGLPNPTTPTPGSTNPTPMATPGSPMPPMAADPMPPTSPSPMPPTPPGIQPPDATPPVQPPTPDVTLPPNVPPELPSTPEASDKQAADTVLAAWEKNFGSLNDSPGIKSALLDLVQSGGLSNDGKSGLADLLSKGVADKDNLPGKSWFDKDSGPGSWKWPDLGLKASDLKMPETGLSSPSMPSAPSLDAPSASVVGGALGSLLVVAAVVALGLLLWRFWPTVRRLTGQQTDLRAKPWPFDPRTVTDRAKLVRAFEFLSVLLCGDAARVWNHKTIATSLRAKVVGANPVADELAALYELARYTPADHPLTDADYAAARRALCHLAGVNPA